MRARSKEKSHIKKTERKSGTRPHEALRTMIKILGFYSSDNKKPMHVFYWMGIRLKVEKEARPSCRSQGKKGLWPGQSTI